MIGFGYAMKKKLWRPKLKYLSITDYCFWGYYLFFLGQNQLYCIHKGSFGTVEQHNANKQRY